MRPRPELDFIRDRVIEHVHANPPTGPLLTERTPPAPAETCRWGHAFKRKKDGKQFCPTCEANRKRAKRMTERGIVE